MAELEHTPKKERVVEVEREESFKLTLSRQELGGLYILLWKATGTNTLDLLNLDQLSRVLHQASYRHLLNRSDYMVKQTAEVRFVDAS